MMNAVWCFVAFAGCLAGLVTGIVLQHNDDRVAFAFNNVCKYEGGTVQGDVCVKDNTIILNRKSVESKVK